MRRANRKPRGSEGQRGAADHLHWPTPNPGWVRLSRSYRRPGEERPAEVSVSHTAPCAARAAPPGGTHPIAAVIGEALSPVEPLGVDGRDGKKGRRVAWVEVGKGRTEWEEEVSLD